VTRTTLRNKGQVTLPAEVREALHVDEGDELEFEIVEPGVVVVRGLKMIPAAQAWFWTKSWQSGERQASEEIASGQLSGVYTNIDEMFTDLEAGALCPRSRTPRRSARTLPSSIRLTSSASRGRSRKSSSPI
jgi:antitoxin PrlF